MKRYIRSSKQSSDSYEYKGVKIYNKDGYYYIFLGPKGTNRMDFESDKAAREYIDSIKSNIQSSTDIEEYPEVSYHVYELDEYGDEIDVIESFSTLDEAIAFAETCDFPTHICFIPGTDPDDDPDYEEYLEYNYEYEPYEVVWESN